MASLAADPLISRLRHLRPAEVDARRALYAQTRIYGDGDNEARFASRRRAPAVENWIELRGVGFCGWLGLEDDRAATLVDGREWANFEDDSRLLAWALAHHGIVELVARIAGAPLTPNHIAGAPPSSDPSHLYVYFSATIGDQLCRGWLVLNPTSALRLSANTSVALERNGAAITYPVAVLTKPVLVRRDALLRTGRGDIIVLGTGEAFATVLLTQRVGANLSILATADWRDGRLRVKGLGSDTGSLSYQGGIDMSRSESQIDPDTLGDAVASEARQPEGVSLTLSHRLRSQVQFEVGSLALTAEELSHIEPGYVFQLDTPAADQQVGIVVDGQTIGRGTLVVAGEQLGVQLTEWC